jgi:ribosome-associated protein
LLTDEEKEVLLKRLASKLTVTGVLLLVAQESRSQFENKQAVIVKLNEIFTHAFAKRKVRRPTKPTKSSVIKRKETKTKLSEKKKWRKNLE